MCGIAGSVVAVPGAEDRGSREKTVAAMVGALAHRGPDAEGLWADDRAVLGHRRLAIIDIDPASCQPMADADGRFTLVYNGELYNYAELRRELAPYPFRTKGDAEVLLAAWGRWGVQCLDRLEGMFAFAIWDAREGELFLVRDRLGEKPLYHTAVDGQLLFASEVRALLASGRVERRINVAALGDQLRYGTVHGPDTIVRGVQILLPGHVLRWSQGKSSTWPWWDMVQRADASADGLDRESIHRQVREHFFRAVEKRLVADVPFGAFLSGGIDSSAVVGAMARIAQEPVRSFTVTFDEAQFNEADFAKVVARKFGTHHTEIRLKPEDMLRWIPEILGDMDHPSADGPNTWVVAKMTKEAGITMALSGLGGDEVFAGYNVFKRSYALHRFRLLAGVPRPVRAMLGQVVRKVRPGAAGWKMQAVLAQKRWDVVHTYPWARLGYLDPELGTLLAHQVPPDAVLAGVRSLLGNGAGRQLPVLSQVSVAELMTYIPDVLLRDTDQMSMAHALEVRSPFLDHALLEFVLGVGDAVKYPHSPKQLLTNALGDLLPHEVVHRPKMGFTLPWDRWMRDQLHAFCRSRIHALAARPQFRREGIMALWDRFLHRDPGVTALHIWTLVVLEHWLDLHRMQ